MVDIDVASETPFLLDGELPTAAFYRQCYGDPTQASLGKVPAGVDGFDEGNVEVTGAAFFVDNADESAVTDWLADRLDSLTARVDAETDTGVIVGSDYRILVSTLDADQIGQGHDQLVLLLAQQRDEAYCERNRPRISAPFDTDLEQAAEERSVTFVPRWGYGLLYSGVPDRREREDLTLSTDGSYDLSDGGETLSLADGIELSVSTDTISLQRLKN